jgi:hypothetical protein
MPTKNTKTKARRTAKAVGSRPLVRHDIAYGIVNAEKMILRFTIRATRKQCVHSYCNERGVPISALKAMGYTVRKVKLTFSA